MSNPWWRRPSYGNATTLDAGGDPGVDAPGEADTAPASARWRSSTAVSEPPAGCSSSGRALSAGTLVKHYEVIRPLGEGGMGQVYLARDTKLGRLVALKWLLKRGEAGAQRLLIEARATARCKHENIVVIYEVDEHEGDPYLVLEYVEGSTLRDWLGRRAWAFDLEAPSGPGEPAGALPARAAVELMVPVVRALACAHRQGVVHRDLKPENVLLSDAGHVKVVDFGLAKQAGEGEAPGEGDGLFGTYLYMAPEQWRREALDARADLWAVGVMLFELCAGAHPLEPVSLDRLALVADPLTPMPSLGARRPDLGALAEIVDRCLAKPREARFRSADKLLAELEAFLAERPAAAPGGDECPFAGLSAFQEGDAARFFGRAPDVASALRALRSRPLLAVVGASGAGKSSFVRAGVIPALKRSGEPWQAFVVRLGKRPLAALADVLVQASEARDVEAPAELVAALREQPGQFGARLRAHCRGRGAKALVFVDQFEELYTLGVDADERAAVLACLEGAADDASSPLRVMLALRTDFLDRAADDRRAFAELARGLVLLSPVGREGLREALTRPVEGLGYCFESEALVEQMLDALAGTRTPLPLLQFAASKLWAARDVERRLLTEASYERIGGVGGALAAHADEALAGLSDREQRLCGEILRRLVTPERTRAVVSLGELRLAVGAGGAGRRPGDVEQVVRRLVDARLLSIEAGGDEASLEIVHESLIESWPQLGRWLDEGAHDAQFLARLRAAAQQWQAGGEAEGLLWRDDAAAEARAWLERRRAQRGEHDAGLGEREGRYLAAVVGLADRARRLRRRAVAGAIAALSVTALAFSSLALRAREEAAQAQDEARRTRNATRMAAAREKQADPTTALALVRELEPPDLPRGWSTMADGALRQGTAAVVLSHADAVYWAEFSPDGRQIVTGSNDKAVRVWPADGQGEPLVLRGHEGYIYSVTFSPDGRRVVSTSFDKTVRVWPADGRGEPLVLRGHEGWVYWAAFSPDGRQIVSASDDKTVRVWNADGVGEPLVLRGHEQAAFSASFSPDGRRIVTASGDGLVRVFRADGQGEPLVLRGHDDTVVSAGFSPDGRRIVSASDDKTVRVWNADGVGEPLVLRGHDDVVAEAAFSPDGRRVVSASRDKTVRVWNADGVGEPLVLRGHERFVHSAAFSPDGRRVVSSSDDGTVRVWRADGAAYPTSLRGHQQEIRRVAWSADGRHIATASFDKTVRVWAADGQGEPLILQGHEASVGAVAFSPDGTRVATGADDDVARVWRLGGGPSVAGEPVALQGHAGAINGVAFSPDGKRVVTASSDKTARVWGEGSGEPLTLRGHDDAVTSVAFSPDGRRIVTGSYDKTVRVWPADRVGEPLVLRGHDDVVTAVAFSPDGRQIATGSYDKTARVWAADGAGEPLVLRGHEHWIQDVAFSPDGALVATASLDHTVRLWRPGVAGDPLTLRHEAQLNAVAFSPDGKRIVIGPDDNVASVWAGLEPLRGVDDPRLWAATSYCPTADRRVALLHVPDAQARADERACRRRVAAGGSHLPRFVARRAYCRGRQPERLPAPPLPLATLDGSAFAER
jgi:WD40 repeat protein